MKITYIDPPNGWKYGFPKELPPNMGNIHGWLIENGYPQKEIDNFGQHFRYKLWTEGEDEDDS